MLRDFKNLTIKVVAFKELRVRSNCNKIFDSEFTNKI